MYHVVVLKTRQQVAQSQL